MVDNEMDIKAWRTVNGKVEFVCYTGAQHLIAETKEEMMGLISTWADEMLKRNKKE